jgi:hypothetical protein
VTGALIEIGKCDLPCDYGLKVDPKGLFRVDDKPLSFHSTDSEYIDIYHGNRVSLFAFSTKEESEMAVIYGIDNTKLPERRLIKMPDYVRGSSPMVLSFNDGDSELLVRVSRY